MLEGQSQSGVSLLAPSRELSCCPWIAVCSHSFPSRQGPCLSSSVTLEVLNRPLHPTTPDFSVPPNPPSFTSHSSDVILGLCLPLLSSDAPVGTKPAQHLLFASQPRKAFRTMASTHAHTTP